MQSINSLKQFLKNMKKHFNKQLAISVKYEEIFQSSKNAGCKKLFTDEDKKVRDHEVEISVIPNGLKSTWLL